MLQISLKRLRLPQFAGALFLLLLLMIAGLAGYFTFDRKGIEDRGFVRGLSSVDKATAWPFWNDLKCSKFFGLEPCQISSPLDQVHLMILGDSHGNQLYPGIAKNSSLGVLSTGQCPPLLGVHVGLVRDGGKSLCTPADTVEKNLDILRKNPQINAVLLAAFWTPLLNTEFVTKREKENLGAIELKMPNNNISEEIVLEGVSNTIQKLNGLDRKIIFIRDTPYIEADFKEFCIKRASAINLNNFNCTIPTSQVISRRQKEDVLIENLVKRYPKLTVFDPMDSLCNARECFVIKSGVPLFRDAHHLSVDGSVIVGANLITKYIQ